ncbi:unnamed protein product, partial [Trichogramma brassicae]
MHLRSEHVAERSWVWLCCTSAVCVCQETQLLSAGFDRDPAPLQGCSVRRLFFLPARRASWGPLPGGCHTTSVGDDGRDWRRVLAVAMAVRRFVQGMAGALDRATDSLSVSSLLDPRTRSSPGRRLDNDSGTIGSAQRYSLSSVLRIDRLVAVADRKKTAYHRPRAHLTIKFCRK